MKILKKNLKTGRAQIKHKRGYVNSVLAVHKNSIYCESNTYIGKWTVTNTEYYNLHPEEYEGYVELEFLVPPKKVKLGSLDTSEDRIFNEVFQPAVEEILFCPAKPWYVRLWRKFFPLKGIEVPADGKTRELK